MGPPLTLLLIFYCTLSCHISYFIRVIDTLKVEFEFGFTSAILQLCLTFFTIYHHVYTSGLGGGVCGPRKATTHNSVGDVI